MKNPSAFRTPELLSLLILQAFLLVFVQTLFAQDVTKSPNSTSTPVLMEYPEHEYVYSPRESHSKSPAYNYSSRGFSIVQVNVDENGNNIDDDAANEPSITFDPIDPGRMAIGWRQFDHINNNFRQAGYAFTTDAGQTWTFPGVIEPGIFRSDPVLRSDGEGNFYYNSLTASGNDYWCNVYGSANGGSSWDLGTFAQGGDKQWMSIDRSNGIGGGNIYAFWTYAYSICPPDGFTRSTDHNFSYESCSSIPGDPYWGTTMVSPTGVLYVCGLQQWGGFMVAKSSTAQNPGADVSWDYTVSVNLGGEAVGFGGYDCPNPSGLLGQTIIAMDSSDGPGHGYVYLLCSVESNTNSDPCDVRFARSTDGGLTWDPSKRINDDIGNNNYQWFGTMSVAPDGRIDAAWLDTRDNPGAVNSALYYSYSMDQGTTWSTNVKLSESFDPHIGWPQQDKMGDYFDMYSDEAGAHLAWAATFNGEQDVYYSLIIPEGVGMQDQEEVAGITLLENYPNPFKNQTTIRYQLLDKEQVVLKVYSVTGREVATLVNEIKEPGMHQVVFEASNLESGVYYYRLQAGNESLTKRFIILQSQ